MRRRLLAASTAAAVVALWAIGLPALAHVSVQPEQVEGGSSPTLTFRVPNERDDGTVKVEIFLPEGAGLTATPAPVAGWTATADDTKVTWEGGPIPADGSQEFSAAVGPMPAAGGPLVFKALQTYESGEVVRWIEEPAAGAEPEHPAPVLDVLPAPEGATTTTTTTAPTTTTTTDATTDATTTTEANTTTTEIAGEDDEDDDGSGWVPIAVVVLALVAVGAGAAVIARRRRDAGGPI